MFLVWTTFWQIFYCLLCLFFVINLISNVNDRNNYELGQSRDYSLVSKNLTFKSNYLTSIKGYKLNSIFLTGSLKKKYDN